MYGKLRRVGGRKLPMIALVIPCITAFCAVLFHLIPSQVRVGDTIPPFTLASADGGNVRCDAVADRCRLLYFFSYNCVQCRNNLMALEKIVQNYSHSVLADRLYIINVDHRDIWRRNNGRLSSALPLYHDRNRVFWRVFGFYVVPVAVTLEENNKIARIWYGLDASADTVERMLLLHSAEK